MTPMSSKGCRLAASVNGDLEAREFADKINEVISEQRQPIVGANADKQFRLVTYPPYGLPEQRYFATDADAIAWHRDNKKPGWDYSLGKSSSGSLGYSDDGFLNDPWQQETF